MQPNHQIIQEQIAIDGCGDVVLENAAGPPASPSKMNRIGARNVTGHCAHRRIPPLYGETNFISFAAATVYRSAAPEEHALSDGGQGVPILFIQHKCLGAPPTQDQMNNLFGRATHCHL
jgi:hypothetical protein